MSLTPLTLEPVQPKQQVLIVAHGRPITQGSKTRTHYGMRDDNAKTLKPWRESVKTAALEAMVGRERILRPVALTATFYFERPQAHYGTGRNARVVKPSAPEYPANRGSGDTDKLLRAVCDALTDGGVWLDDSLVIDVWGRKRYVTDFGGGLRIPGVVLEIAEV